MTATCVGFTPPASFRIVSVSEVAPGQNFYFGLIFFNSNTNPAAAGAAAGAAAAAAAAAACIY